MHKYIYTTKEQEKAVLIGVIYPYQDEKTIEEYLDELAFLAETAGAVTIKKFYQHIDTPNPSTFIGIGKLNEIALFVEKNNPDMVIFDDDLTPSQLRNIEKIIPVKVLDRTNLILDIFATRAKTAHAKAQVELAQYNYLLPRLKRMWTHLERQRGGIGLRGPGETELETDKRIIRYRISKLKELLKNIEKQKELQRKHRKDLVRVALVGYTNVGKSTIMNLLSKSDVFAENKLFATLDTTIRKVVINNVPFLLSDTVGFIRKLPHHLVESFKSTLDEVKESDILLHIVDISHSNFEEQIKIVNNTLYEIGVIDKPIITVFNKIDNYKYIPKQSDDLTPYTSENISIEELMNKWIAKNNTPSIFISATKKINIEEFKQLLFKEVVKIETLRYPYKIFSYNNNNI